MKRIPGRRKPIVTRSGWNTEATIMAIVAALILILMVLVVK